MSKYTTECFPQTMPYSAEFYPWCHYALIPDPPLPVRLYGVSSGNGNDGVSQIFPDYYVRTDDPYLLAECAMLALWKDPNWAKENTEVDGEADYTVSAVVSEGPEGETQFGAAEAIIEVFPVDDKDTPDMTDPWHKPVYDSLETAFSTELLAIARA